MLYVICFPPVIDDWNLIGRIETVIPIPIDHTHCVFTGSQDICSIRMVVSEIRNCIAHRTCIWYCRPFESVFQQEAPPNPVFVHHIPKISAMVCQCIICFIPTQFSALVSALTVQSSVLYASGFGLYLTNIFLASTKIVRQKTALVDELPVHVLCNFEA